MACALAAFNWDCRTRLEMFAEPDQSSAGDIAFSGGPNQLMPVAHRKAAVGK